MKIRRFVAKDMRTALSQIKDELGADAVIMSNKKIVGGVELMAAVDYGVATPEAKLNKTPTPNTPKTNSLKSERQMNDDVVSLTKVASPKAISSSEDSLEALLKRQSQAKLQPTVKTTTQETGDQTPSLISSELKQFAEKLANQHPYNENEHSLGDEIPSTVTQPINNEFQATDSVSKNELNGVKNDIALIKQLLQQQVAGLMWQDIARNEPIKALLVKKLLTMGLSAQVADRLACFIPEASNETDAWQQVLGILANQIATTNNDILHRGGVVSLVGPTGVGKTTTIAKLAARGAQLHGAENILLISTDTYRIAGYEQLLTYGKIIGCTVKQAKNNEELDDILLQHRNKKIILIDTAGMGQRDMRLAKQLSHLVNKANVKIKNYLVLSANTQPRVMQESVEQFKKIPLSGCIFTKIDESLSLGEIISTSIQNALPIGYLTDGQRVPEDIKVANAEKLVKSAALLAEKSPENSDWMPLVANNSAMI